MCSLNETRWPRQCMILDWVLEQKMNSSEKTGKIQLRSAMNSSVWILFVSSCCAQLCQALYDPMDCSLPGSSVHGNFQARILEWVAISFSRGSLSMSRFASAQVSGGSTQDNARTLHRRQDSWILVSAFLPSVCVTSSMLTSLCLSFLFYKVRESIKLYLLRFLMVPKFSDLIFGSWRKATF